MNMHKIGLISAMLVVLLLSACGSVREASSKSQHGSHEAASSPASGDEHSGHGGEMAKAATNLKASFTFGSTSLKANEKSELTIQITDDVGKAVTDFEINHEKLLHLIVVNHNLSSFQHIHPTYQGNGKFTVSTSFDAGGDYKLIADFIPSGGTSTTLSQWVKVTGKEAGHTVLKADAKLRQEVSGKTVELSLSSLKAKDEVTLRFTIRDAQTNKEITNLQPYLGAVGHVVILSADAEQYIHVHPLEENSTGPVAKFATAFPEAGIYKLWGQFQHNDEVFTVPFVVDVK
ncbi:uncharacterized protein YceK [Paenibacillus qinlingensis]|uniref:Uncharacterized protein YceK n=2 Tax=Paenibacillus qinlingensis TaxID=1837343 RepID=A0ABU1P5I9_9BACL|nr:uncharacterized protein YceK [Paenibacillus qinlingensis]